MKAEWLLLIIPLSIFLFWAIWFRLTTWWHKIRYKKENDKSRNGEVEQRDAAESSGTGSSINSLSEPPKPTERSVLETAVPDSVGQNSKRFGGFFARLTRRK